MRTLTALAIAATCAPTLAQPIEIQHNLSFREVDAVTGIPVPHPNGELQPGEGALISLSISFTPPVGTFVNDPAGSGEVHALGHSMLHLSANLPGNTGTWHSRQFAPGFFGSLGASIQGGRVLQTIILTQEAEGADQSNPVEHVWKAIWVPDDYSSRTVTFNTFPAGISPEASSALWIHDSGGSNPYFGALGTTVTGIVQINVSPHVSCYANCDGSTTEPILTVDDFTCFINEFAAALTLPHEQQVTHYVNCDGSTAVPALTVDDFTCFINVFAQGCP